ncbi:STAS domain-containing protein [Ammoniphilus sp. CFH 90114]|uniref:STAS domain-containing protein n=1 Tax=Ammoniphilus sp. CFH 90114 TaxID=2493665 RepID=UPI00100F8507|nr:STAS domain-containing protein [Ammoniphilus sp. CFH 90114]RXT08968.1 anti-sigma factor antagonist [Ammoniphilus sp. CFH 90114]
MIKEIQTANGQVNVSLSGRIYVDVATAMREKLFPYVEKGYKYFSIYLAEVDYIDSSGLGVLVALQKKAVQNGGGVSIYGLHGHVKELFELTRLTRVFDIH